MEMPAIAACYQVV